MDDTSSSQSSLFSGINKYLILLLIIFVLFIAFQLFSYSSRSRVAQKLPTSITPFPTTPDIKPIGKNSTNKDFFLTTQQTEPVTESKLITSEYKGKLQSLKHDHKLYMLTIINEEGTELELVYDDTVPVSPDGLTFEGIRVGNDVIIRETADLAKQYPQSIQSLKITTYVPTAK